MSLRARLPSGTAVELSDLSEFSGEVRSRVAKAAGAGVEAEQRVVLITCTGERLKEGAPLAKPDGAAAELFAVVLQDPQELKLLDAVLTIAGTKSFEELSSFTTLDLFDGRLPGLPSIFCGLRYLQTLVLSCNRLWQLPDDFGQLVGLRALYLNDNRLVALPDSFGQLSSLEILNLCDNRLACLADSFTRLTALKILYLNNNRLKVLPPNFGRLESLEELYLQRNQLEALPMGFGHLRRLAVLYINRNRLFVLPGDFMELSALQTFEAHENWAPPWVLLATSQARTYWVNLGKALQHVCHGTR